ncbi:MAG TPA: hypothetical protein VGV87_24450 [Blastocatellia bacterium]|nr:hypothetical protein [Blastocatellia bacterium]
MKTRTISVKLLAVVIVLATLITVGALCGATRTHAASAGGGGIFGTFTWGANQTGRLIVTAPTTGQWSSGRAGEVVLGFDVFRPSTDISAGQQSSGSCVKWHMIERQACQVTLTSGEAASFDVNGDGVSSFQPVIMTSDGNAKDLLITFEVTEGGRIVTAVGIPTVQKNQVDH